MVTLKTVKPVSTGKFLSKYELIYETEDGNNKAYEMVSHNSELAVDTMGQDQSGIVLLVFDRNHEHMLLGVEFRMAINHHIINNISGFIEPGETPEQAAARKLREKTGLELTKILNILPFSFSCASVTDMTAALVICEASGGIIPSENPNEEISPVWFSKGQLQVLLKDPEVSFSGRAQALVYMWCEDM